MIKRINIVSLAEGGDPDEVWKYWVETHAPAVVENSPKLRKYAVSRVTKILPGPEGVRDPGYWGMVEMWFDNEEDHNQAMKSQPRDDFGKMVSNPRVVMVEERVFVDSGQ